MTVRTETLLQALAQVRDPHTDQDYVSTRALRDLRVDGGNVSFELELGYPA